MLITARVFTSLFTVGILAILCFAVGDVSLAAAYKVNRSLDRLLRKVPTEQYFQLVVLPLCGAIAGGLISTALPIFLDHPWWKPDGRTYVGLALVAIGLVVIVAGPLAVHILYENPKNLIIAIRIERLKNGDRTDDSKADVIKTIDEERVEITKKLNIKNAWFLASLILVIAAGAGWLSFVYIAFGTRTCIVLTLVISATILCAIFARYWIRPRSLLRARKDLKTYEAVADKLSPPASTTPSCASADSHHHNQHDLKIAIGGLLVGAILAGLGAVHSRGQRRG